MFSLMRGEHKARQSSLVSAVSSWRWIPGVHSCMDHLVRRQADTSLMSSTKRGRAVWCQRCPAGDGYLESMACRAKPAELQSKLASVTRSFVASSTFFRRPPWTSRAWKQGRLEERQLLYT